MSKQTKFSLAISLQILIIFGIILYKSLILLGGTTVLLLIEPVDPRDPLRGDYITLNYSGLSRVRVASVSGEVIRNADTVYVSLEPHTNSNSWGYNSISKLKPSRGVFLKGKVASGGSDSQSIMSPGPPSRSINILYGIEEYFIEEGTGSSISWDRVVLAEVSIDEDGRAVLKRVFNE